jgi:hypothetical protein
VLLEARDGSRELAAVPAVLGASALFASAASELASRPHSVCGLSSMSHVWEVDAAEVARQLAARHPAVLAHFARRFLARLGALAAQLEAAASPAAGTGPPAPRRQRAQEEHNREGHEDQEEQHEQRHVQGQHLGQQQQQGQEQIQQQGAGGDGQAAHEAPGHVWSGGLLPLPPREGSRRGGASQRLCTEELLAAWGSIQAGVAALAASLEQAAEEAAAAEEACSATGTHPGLSRWLRRTANGQGTLSGNSNGSGVASQKPSKQRQRWSRQHQRRRRAWPLLPCWPAKQQQQHAAAHGQAAAEEGHAGKPGSGGSGSSSSDEGGSSGGNAALDRASSARAAAALDVYGGRLTL